MRYRRILFALVGGGALLGILLAAGGYNVSAAAGHLPPVAALLHWTMQNSVTLRAGTPPPQDLHSDERVLAGAGQYDLVCRDCHGAPGVPLTAVAHSLEPPPPHILDAVGDWQPEELFWIVKHGIKMTAMPAWPAQARDDEVWSVVAFLLRLPDMSQDTYRRMTMGPVAGERPRAVDDAFDAELARCARCHGYDGSGVGAFAVPRLGGQSAQYLHASLAAFASGRRASGIMQAQATMAQSTYFDALARHFAAAGDAVAPSTALAPRAGAEGREPVARGRALAAEGDSERLIPACAGCHGPVFYPRADHYPRIAGQPVAYLRTQLELFRNGSRGGSPYASIMHMAAKHLEDGDIAALARYYASLAPSPSPAPAGHHHVQ